MVLVSAGPIGAPNALIILATSASQRAASRNGEFIFMSGSARAFARSKICYPSEGSCVRRFVREPTLAGRGQPDSYGASLQHGIPMTTGRRIPIGWVAAEYRILGASDEV